MNNQYFYNRVAKTFAILSILITVSWLPSTFSLASLLPSSSFIGLSPVVTRGLEQPVFLTHTNDQSPRLFVVEQAGRIRIVEKGRLLSDPFLDLGRSVSFGGERGLLGLAFHPQFMKNGRFFVNYTRAGDGTTVISEFHGAPTANRAQPEETVLLLLPQPYRNHNGGMIVFGPDGFLYIGTGDGGAGGDPENRGQNLRELLGKFLRIDVNHGSPYAIPKDNPFVATQHRPEIFAFGFRNPWRFSFDKTTGELWAADVGQNRWEEINRVEKGKNYGWRIMEGLHCYQPSTGCSQKGLILPVAEYGHDSGRCSIIGGYVYRGQGVPQLQGRYIFGDYCSGEIMSLENGQVKVLLSTGLRISSFGEDAAGELYLVDHGGGIYKMIEDNPVQTR